jgi:hypothetical protein
MPTGQIFEDPEVVDEHKNNGKSPHCIEPANHLGVQDLIEFRLNGLEASSRDLLIRHAVDKIISFPHQGRNPLSGSSQFYLAVLFQAEPT